MAGDLSGISGYFSKLRDYPENVGSHSDFYIGTWVRPGYGQSKIVGLKVLRMNGVYIEVHKNDLIKRLKRSVERWVKFSHPNIAPCYGYSIDCGPMPVIIMDYYSEGNIAQYLKAKTPSFEEEAKMVRDVAEGLSHLHGLSPPIVHGDLRAANIFVTKTGRVVIADYELAYMIPSKDRTGYVFEENTRWLAPELLCEDNPTCTTASDIFALAMTIVEITTNGVPFASKPNAVVLRLLDKGQRPDLPAEVLGCAWFSELVQKCWDEEPSARPTASRIVDVFVANSA